VRTFVLDVRRFCRGALMTLIVLAVVECAWPGTHAQAADEPSAAEFFETAVRPILVDVCGRCHGQQKQRGGLRVDSRDAILAGGENGPAISIRQPDKSRLIEAVRRKGDLKMPPDTPLTERQIAALTRWVELGAPWPANAKATTSNGSQETRHWAFQPVRDPKPPIVRDAAWARTPVDRFILARLESEGLTPSPAADQRTLIRRATYDLTGLPPTPEEVEAFLKDESPDAYTRLIDRLLASPAYGEQWGRHWLDLARYSDTKGYVYGREERTWIHAWAYRDWVVNAINQDVPYDRFVLLQLAADQVAAGDPSSQAAMGFLTLGRRFLGVTHDIIDDRIDVVTRGLLGLTVACARCHDHKFDPIPTADYYSLYGVFRSCAEREVPASTKAVDAAFERGLQERQTKLRDGMATARANVAATARGRVAEYLMAQLELTKYPEEAFNQILPPDALVAATVRRWRDYLTQTAANHDPVFAAWHAFTRLPAAEFATRASGVSQELARSPASDVNPLVARMFAVPPRDMQDVALRYGQLFARLELQRAANRVQATLVRLSGYMQSPFGVATDPVRSTEASLDPAAEAVLRVLYGANSPCEVPDEPIVNTEQYFPFHYILSLWALQLDVDKWLVTSPAAPPYATVLVDRPTPTNARILRRGNPASLGVEVPRQFLRVVAGPDRQPFQKGSGRLELARAIIDANNPLTARVMVNRVWQHHFGAGLVRTSSDFGTRAEPPSHPELLDWLAHRFVIDGWSLKALHRQLMLSAAYQQSSTGPTDQARLDRARVRDPENHWLWRANVHRLSFEELHDSLFAANGELDRRAGGKATDLLAPPFSPRRAVYGLIDRQFFPSLLRVFDVANPDLHVSQRSETTVPQQALFFLNHPLPLGRAKSLAHDAAIAPTPEAKVEKLYRLAYQRPPTPAQVRQALDLVRAAEAEPDRTTVARPTAWAYGYGAFDVKAATLTGFHALPYYSGTAWQGGPAWPDASLGWARLTADGGHPGNDLGHAVVRRWTAPVDGTVRVRSTLHHMPSAGDGVRGSILSSRHGLLISAIVHHGQKDLDVPTLAVHAGDTLDFVTDIRDTLNNDQFTWAPVVEQVGDGGTVWSAKADFGGTPTEALGAWEQLAQALLMANEFSFVD
jgi:hypothetical protein